MCVVIDANTIGKVFNQNGADHARFKPLARWVLSGSGSVIFGGTKYLLELGQGPYLRLYSELVKAGRAVQIDKKSVDDFAKALKNKVPDEAFNDEHIVALVSISRCCLVCTDDLASLPYLRCKDLYPPGVKVPHIYRNASDRKHCCRRMVVAICSRKPASFVRHHEKPKPRARVKVAT